MATSLWQLLEKYSVAIPIIQRDYAQGRKMSKVTAIRKRFLKELHKALVDDSKPVELDFIYGYCKEEDSNKVFIPLDGQQRLTTLFLLHWYFAVKENQLSTAVQYLEKFSYQTRHSSRVFCANLVQFSPDLTECLSETITNQPWFFTAWKNDPTIRSMLVVLDDIQSQFEDISSGWPKLTSTESKIVFHLLPMDKLGLPDDLYIKMNSRGKELTEFEYFKSRFSEILSEDQADIFNHKIDQSWSDLFWNFFKDKDGKDIAKLVDQSFMRFFNYMTDMLILRYAIGVDRSEEEFELYKQVYSNTDCVNYLFDTLDKLHKVSRADSNFFSTIFYKDESEFDTSKVRLFTSDVDLFFSCISSYHTNTNLFSIGDQLLLFACIEHLVNNTDDFERRVRKLRNLIANSDDTVRRENMPVHIIVTLHLVWDGNIIEDHLFNSRQVEEEKLKDEIIDQNPNLLELMYRSEDHDILRGCLAVFISGDTFFSSAGEFFKVFTDGCNYDLISRALLCFGDYSQQYGKSFRRFGTKNRSVWRELFTPSQRRGDFGKTKDSLQNLLLNVSTMAVVDLEKTVANYLEQFDADKQKPKDFIYYFIKYEWFRKWHWYQIEGFYYWPGIDRTKPYECFLMSRTQLNGRWWSPFLLALKTAKSNLSIEDYGQPLVYSQGPCAFKITNINSGFKLDPVGDESLEVQATLKQNNILDGNGVFNIFQDNGLDIEDRIQKGKELVEILDRYTSEKAKALLMVDNAS